VLLLNWSRQEPPPDDEPDEPDPEPEPDEEPPPALLLPVFGVVPEPVEPWFDDPEPVEPDDLRGVDDPEPEPDEER
jgi:hypothetical protein